MRVAFYAPLKPPGHPVPSGDRRLARLFMTALARGGHEVDLACRFRSWEGIGDGARIRRLQALGEGLARRLIRRYRATEAPARPEAWFTYHAYHKAPDWVGPEVSDALSIPYLLAEASVSAAQAKGPWSGGYRCTVKAVKHADAVIGLNSADAPGVLPLLAHPDRMIALKPFLDVEAFRRSAGVTGAADGEARGRLAARYGLEGEAPWLLGVAMMRDGDKLASYEVLGDALAGLKDRPWQRIIVGDGPARQRVERSFAWAGADRVRFTGLLTAKELAPLYGASDVFVWPAVNEAFGMAILEAQAAGLAVVAGDSHGVRDIVGDGETGFLVPEGDAPAFAAALGGLLDDPARRAAMARSALSRVGESHDIAAAAETLNAVLAMARERQRS
jgi:hypothetical protein